MALVGWDENDHYFVFVLLQLQDTGLEKIKWAFVIVDRQG